MRDCDELKIAVAGTGYVGLSIATSPFTTSWSCCGRYYSRKSRYA